MSLRGVAFASVGIVERSDRAGNGKVILLKSCCWERVRCLDMWNRGLSGIGCIGRMVGMGYVMMGNGFVLRSSFLERETE